MRLFDGIVVEMFVDVMLCDLMDEFCGLEFIFDWVWFVSEYYKFVLVLKGVVDKLDMSFDCYSSG